MVVDVGGGTTEVAVISLGSIVVARSLRTGGYDLDDAISTHLRLEHRMAIGTQSAEQIKLAIASAEPLPTELRTRIRGRDLLSGLPREIELDSIEVRQAIEPAVAAICEAVHEALEETPPELAADITKEGILLAGGGALLRGLVDRVHLETGMPVRMADSPLTCVAEGAGMSLEELDALGGRRRPY
jgi:rod shape-determining protein MreB